MGVAFEISATPHDANSVASTQYTHALDSAATPSNVMVGLHAGGRAAASASAHGPRDTHGAPAWSLQPLMVLPWQLQYATATASPGPTHRGASLHPALK